MALTKVSYGLITADASSADLNIDANTMFVDSSANKVGIGTNSPAQALHVVSAANQIRIEDSTNSKKYDLNVDGNNFMVDDMTAGANRFTIKNGGNVGIGTTNPLDLLHLNSSSGDVRMLLNAPTDSDAEIKLSENGTVKYTIGHDAASDNFVIGTTNVDTEQRLVINSSGSVGIGTVSPSKLLHIKSADPVIRLEDSSPSAYAEIDGAGGDLIISCDGGDDDSNSVIKFKVDNSEKMQIDSSGNVNIITGTLNVGNQTVASANAAADDLVIKGPGTTATGMTISNSSDSGTGTIFFGDTSSSSVAGFRYNHNTGDMALSVEDDFAFSTDSAERMRLDSRGMLGLGTTPPSDTHTTWSQLFIGQKGSLISERLGSGGLYGTYLTDNLYVDTDTGNFAYRVANEASAYLQEASTHRWYSAASGSAGAAVTLTERLRMDAEGNISFGTQKVDPNWSQFFNAFSGNYGGHLSFQNNNVPVTTLGNNFYINNSTLNERVIAYPTQQFKLDHQGGFLWESAASGTAGATFSFTEKMRLDINGNLGIGTNSPSRKLEVAGVIQSNGTIAGGGGMLFMKATDASSADDNPYGRIRSFNSAGTVVAEIKAASEGTGNNKAHWEFFTYDGSSSTNKMRIRDNGTVQVFGALSKGSGSFEIPHPLYSKKDTHLLRHSFIEGPQCDNIYRGTVDLVDGIAQVNLDTVSNMTSGTFLALNTNLQVFTTNETDWDNVKGTIVGNILTITCQNISSTAKVSWLVIGERQDDNIKSSTITDNDGKLITEPEVYEGGT